MWSRMRSWGDAEEMLERACSETGQAMSVAAQPHSVQLDVKMRERRVLRQPMGPVLAPLLAALATIAVDV